LATVLAIGYPDEVTAERVAPELRGRRAELLVQTDAIAVIVRGASGDYRVLTTHRAVTDEPSWGMFWSVLFGLLFFVPVFGTAVGPALGTLFGKFEKNGIHRGFQQQARDMLGPGSSVLFVLADGPGPGPVLDAIDGFGGTVVSSSLTRQQESGLQEALYGRLEAP
jgi:uncharacterized membrane protein